MYQIIGGKKELINKIFQGCSVKCFLQQGDKISWDVTNNRYDCISVYDYTFNNIYNWKSKKQCNEVLKKIFEHFDYIEKELKK